MTLFTPLRLREIEFRNRIGVSPMCQYSARDGHPGTWHLVHLGSRAVGGAALVMTEASAVQRWGAFRRPTVGMYLDAHVDSWRPVVEFLKGTRSRPRHAIGPRGTQGKYGRTMARRRTSHARAGRLDACFIHQRSIWCRPSDGPRVDPRRTRSGRGQFPAGHAARPRGWF